MVEFEEEDQKQALEEIKQRARYQCRDKLDGLVFYLRLRQLP